jgi:4-oxalocrotonate tautomerase
MPFANFTVPAGTLDEKQKEEIVTRTTELYVEIYGERARANTMVLVGEVTDGGWGIGGNVLTLAMLAQFARRLTPLPTGGERDVPPPGAP